MPNQTIDIGLYREYTVGIFSCLNVLTRQRGCLQIDRSKPASDWTNLDEFIKKSLDDAKGKYLRKLGIGHKKYVETLKMFEELSKITKGLSKEVQSPDEFDKLKHHVVEIHPLATREIVICMAQPNLQKVAKNSFRENRLDNFYY